jgi:glycerophosphoryl diester phosphodiesterase
MRAFLNTLRPSKGHPFFILSVAIFISGCASPRHITVPGTVPAATPEQIREDVSAYPCTQGAHRGDSVVYMENTLSAIRSARQNPKYKFIEFDVQYSADKQAVVFHDGTLKRIFGQPDKVKDTPYKELCRLSGNKISTYKQVMALAVGKPLNIEIKSQGNQADDEQLIDYIMTDLKERGIEDNILISSISAKAIKYVKARYPEMPTGQIFWRKASTYLPFDFLTEGLYQEIDESKADYLMLHVSNQRNIKDLLRLKPKRKTLVFWDFDNTMYLVHKDPTDRLWSDPSPQPLATPGPHYASLSTAPIK